MKKANKEYWKRICSFIYMYLAAAMVLPSVLIRTKTMIELSLLVVVPYLLFSLFTQKHVTLYL